MIPDRLVTTRLVLRRLTPADRPAFWDMVSTRAVVRDLANWPWPPDPARLDGLFADAATHPERGFVITYGGELAGSISTGPDIGFMLRPDFQGRGIMTEALAAVTRHAFSDLDHTMLEGAALTGNYASQNVFRACGFDEVGKGETFVRARGAVMPHLHFRLNRADWAARAPFVLRTARTRIRPLSVNDAAGVTRIAGRKAVARMLGYVPHPLTDAARDKWMEARRYRGTPSFAAGVFADDNRLLGVLGIGGEPLSFYMFFDPAVHRKGFATEAGTAFLQAIDTRFGPVPIEADCFDDNPASARCLAALGFRETGRDIGTSLARAEAAPIRLFRRDAPPRAMAPSLTLTPRRDNVKRTGT